MSCAGPPLYPSDGCLPLSAGLFGDRFVSHALAACGAFVRGEYVPFLKLYHSAPRMAPYFMDLLLEKLRHKSYGVLRVAGGSCAQRLS
jgi:hypothetical protein